MIPLRVLHLVVGQGPELLAAQATATALASAGHAAVLAGPDLAVPGGLSFRGGWWTWMTGERRRAIRLIARWMPDVLHIHGVAALAPGLDVARRLGLGVVTSLTDTEDPHAGRRLRDPLVGWTLVATEHVRAHALGRIGVPRDRLALIPPIPPVPVPRVPRDLPWRLGIVALPDPRGPAEVAALFAAVDELQRSGLGVEARVHSAWLHPRQRQALPAHHAGPETLPAFLAEVDAVALATTREVPAVVVLAGLAAGVPVLARPVAGLPELVTDGSQGILVDGHGHHAWADALRRLHDHRLRLDMGQAARHEAAERFSAADAIDALVALYRSALGPATSSAKAEVSQTWRRLSEARSR